MIIVNFFYLNFLRRLPLLFPQVKPVIMVSQPIRHPWVNDLQQVVGAPELLNVNIPKLYKPNLLKLITQIEVSYGKIILASVFYALRFG